MNNNTNTYELWENSDSTELLFIPEGAAVDKILFKKVWSCKAKSWNEACGESQVINYENIIRQVEQQVKIHV